MKATTRQAKLRLIENLGREWRLLCLKFPDEQNPEGWRKLAVGLAIKALAEEVGLEAARAADKGVRH